MLFNSTTVSEILCGFPGPKCLSTRERKGTKGWFCKHRGVNPQESPAPSTSQLLGPGQPTSGPPQPPYPPPALRGGVLLRGPAESVTTTLQNLRTSPGPRPRGRPGASEPQPRRGGHAEALRPPLGVSSQVPDPGREPPAGPPAHTPPAARERCMPTRPARPSPPQPPLPAVSSSLDTEIPE